MFHWKVRAVLGAVCAPRQDGAADNTTQRLSLDDSQINTLRRLLFWNADEARIRMARHRVLQVAETSFFATTERA
jgi:hypothetical protein